MKNGGDITLSIVDVGHGSSVVLVAAEHVIVIDTGPKTALLEFLTERHISQISVVILSHADQDHIGGLAELISSGMFRIGKIYLNTDSEKDSAVWDDLLYAISSCSAEGAPELNCCLTPIQSREFNFGDVSLEVLGPSTYLAARGPGSKDRRGRKLSSNSISAVLKLFVNRVPSALLPGDLDDLGLDSMIKAKRTLLAPILLFPHHGGSPGRGSLSGFALRLLKAVRPEFVIFSNGRNRAGFPDPTATAAIRKLLPDCRIACTQLSNDCAVRLPTSPAAHLASVYSHGRAHNRCCAGTVVISFSRNRVVKPEMAAHQEYIRTWAPTALCKR